MAESTGIMKSIEVIEAENACTEPRDVTLECDVDTPEAGVVLSTTKNC